MTLQEHRLKTGGRRSIPAAQLLNVYSGLADLLDSGVPLLKSDRRGGLANATCWSKANSENRP